MSGTTDHTQPAEQDVIISHPGQCCNGYCVEDLGIHGVSTRAYAEELADVVQVAVDRALAKAAKRIQDYSDRRAKTAHQTWFNPIAGARAQGRVAGLDQAAEIVRGVALPPATTGGQNDA